VDAATAWLAAVRKHYPELLAYFTMCLFAGVRPSEARQIEWKDIDLDGSMLTIGASIAKPRHRRIVHLSQNCVSLLREAGSNPRINQAHRIEYIQQKEPTLGWGHDIMRHSFASYHLALHESADKTALEMGNSPQILFKHYRELVKKADAERFFQIK